MYFNPFEARCEVGLVGIFPKIEGCWTITQTFDDTCHRWKLNKTLTFLVITFNDIIIHPMHQYIDKYCTIWITIALSCECHNRILCFVKERCLHPFPT